MNTRFFLVFFSALFTLLTAIVASGQDYDPNAVKKMIKSYKTDPRGPYLDIRWFCKDGSTRPAKDPCPDGPGNQRARYKSAVNELAKKSHIFLGQILATTPYVDFWDEKNANSRLVQYQLEKYLQDVDNGWINRKARFYRGAVQIEDENSWGIDFYTWLLADSNRVKSRYFLIRQSARYIPHATDDKNAQLVRTLSREISDSMVSFQDLRIKIHNMPDAGDIERVRSFQQNNKAKISSKLTPKFDQLLKELRTMYRPFKVNELDSYIKKLPKNSGAFAITSDFIQSYGRFSTAEEKCLVVSGTALSLRRELIKPMNGKARLAIIDIINRLEGLLNVQITQWEAKTVRSLATQLYCLSEAATAFGFLELWEWDQIKSSWVVPQGEFINLGQLSDILNETNNTVQWGTSMVWTHYKPVIQSFRDFEPLAAGFYDELVRGSVLLHLGEKLNTLSDFFSEESGISNKVFDLSAQSTIRGVNPGFAMGELVVIKNPNEKIDFSQNKIYVFRDVPENLKPIAGILSMTEGNPVSHVQLLAKNLGIPSAIISSENMEMLNKYNGVEIFFAVSKRGTVIMKPSANLNQEERDLLRQKKERDDKIYVPTDRILLSNTKILNLRDVDADDSGVICGPKAANSGRLKRMFPDNVVEGIVLPFGVFRQHMEQVVPGETISYWQKLTTIFDAANELRLKGQDEVKVESYVLKRLDTLRNLIKMMPFLPGFRTELEQQFIAVFGNSLGKIPVFVRSDTNMEDLKDFTGAGLNLTVFNVLDSEKILEGIRNVWASPYAERSYKWRQRYLHNPEQVFPSILIMPGVNAEKSGVLITKGVTSGNTADLTVAFNRGVGGAVDGQSAESWVISENNKYHLLAPARELTFLSIPETGGSTRLRTNLESRILTDENLDDLRSFAISMKEKLEVLKNSNIRGPFDIELAFKENKIWLFQIRPYVENKQAATSEYLEMISPSFERKKLIALTSKI